MAEGIFSGAQLPLVAGGATLAAMLAGAISSQTAAAPAQAVVSASASSVKVLAAPAAPLWLWRDGRAIRLTLRKDGAAGQVAVDHTLIDRSGRRPSLRFLPNTLALDGTVSEQTLRLDGEADPEASYSGKLRLTAAGEAIPIEVPISIVPSRPPRYADRVALIGAAAGFLSVAIGGIWALCKVGARRCMLDVEWAAGSWASNTGVASTALNALLAFAAANDPRPLLSQNDYRLLLAVFGIPLILAPVLFNAIRWKCEDGLRGISLGYVLAAAATMLGAQLQLTLLVTMLRDLARAAVLSPTLADALRYLVYAVSIALVCYGNYRVYTALEPKAVAEVAGRPVALASKPLL